mgnify:CR=1 FL=1
MNLRRLVTVLALVVFAAIPAFAQTTLKYPDWSGQWERIGSLNWPPEGYEKAGPAPLTAEYKAI